MQVISCSAWNVRGNQVRVKKELSVCFSVDTVITSHEVIVGFDEAGIDIEDIRSVQRRASNNSWVVTFGSKAVKDAALNEQSITIAGCSVLLFLYRENLRASQRASRLRGHRPFEPLRPSYFFPT